MLADSLFQPVATAETLPSEVDDGADPLPFRQSCDLVRGRLGRTPGVGACYAMQVQIEHPKHAMIDEEHVAVS